jgi:integrase
LFLENITNRHTARAREIDLSAFEQSMKIPAYDFLRFSQEDAASVLSQYRELLLKEGLAASTINRRVATMRALVRFGKSLGVTKLSHADFADEVSAAPSSLNWLDRKACNELIALPDGNTLIGVRERALLSLLCEVPLLSWQIHLLCIASFQPESRLLEVPLLNEVALEEGTDGTAKKKRLHETEPQRFITPVELSAETAESIEQYLCQSPHGKDGQAALFCNVDHRPHKTGSALVPDSILHLVKEYGKRIGFPALNPRTLRVSAIMNALAEADWNPSNARQRFPHVHYWTWERYCTQYKLQNKKETGNEASDT